jgi:hypothetical protein
MSELEMSKAELTSILTPQGQNPQGFPRIGKNKVTPNWKNHSLWLWNAT